MEPIKESILKIINKFSMNKIEDPTIFENGRLVEDFGYDSIAIIRLIVEIEEVYGIVLEDDALDLPTINNIPFIIDYIISNTESEMENE